MGNKHLANGAINAIRGMAHSKAGSYLGAGTAADLLSGKTASKGLLDGVGKWIGSGSTFGQQAARAGVAYMGVMAAGRIASGGGLYRDRSGRFNAIGVPFV
jgi:hypothetical protein